MNKQDDIKTLQVRHHNDLHKVPLKGLTEVELNLFFAICAKVENHDIKTVTLDFDYIRSISNFGHISNEELWKQLRQMSSKLAGIQYSVVENKEWVLYNLFIKFESNLDEKTLTVHI